MLAPALVILFAPLPAASGPDAALDHETTARAIVDGLASGRPERVMPHLDARMRGLMSGAKLGALWADLERSLGDFVRVERSAVSSLDGLDAVFVRCQMKSAALDVQLLFDERGRVSGLFFEPQETPTAATGWALPPYANTDEITEEPLLLEDASLAELILTRPRQADDRLPVLVIGPAPIEEGARANELRPHKDLALGLASLGIAVLRFEPKSPDARLASEAALRAIIKHEAVDPERVALAIWRPEALPSEPALVKALAAVVWPKGAEPSEVEAIRAATKTWRILTFEAGGVSAGALGSTPGLSLERYPELDRWLTRGGQPHVHPEVVEDIASFLFRLPARARRAG